MLRDGPSAGVGHYNPVSSRCACPREGIKLCGAGERPEHKLEREDIAGLELGGELRF